MLGTCFLMFCVCGVTMGDAIIHGGMSILGHAIAATFTIMFIIFCIGDISGAHINPAITIAFASLKLFPWSQVPWYVGAQFIGSIFGTILAKSVYGANESLLLTMPLRGVGVAFFMEMLVSMDFMFLACAVTSQGKVAGQEAVIAIGISVALNILLAGPISGASMNPARSLGPAMVNNNYKSIWVYLFAPPLGAIIGGFLYKFLNTRHQN